MTMDDHPLDEMLTISSGSSSLTLWPKRYSGIRVSVAAPGGMTGVSTLMAFLDADEATKFARALLAQADAFRKESRND